MAKAEDFEGDSRIIGGEDPVHSLLRDLIEPSQAQNEAWERHRTALTDAGAIEPAVDKGILCRRVANSAPIKENIAVYENAIEGFGYDLIPFLDPDADDSREQVGLSLWYRRIEERELQYQEFIQENPNATEKEKVENLASLPSDEELEPSSEDIEKELLELRKRIRFQKMKAERFFKNAARVGGRPVGMINLRKTLRNDLETTGECFIEVLRDGRGNIRRFVHLRSVSLRKMPLKPSDKFEVYQPERVDAFTVRKVRETRTFRRFVQVDPESFETRYFKTLGDPRCISSKTGEVFKSIQEMKETEGGDSALANEILSWEIYDPESVNGCPRWFCLSADVVGHAKSSEINYLYFDNKGIPPFLVTVAGGHLSKGLDKKVGDLLGKMKGSDNFHKILVLEAVPAKSNSFAGATPQKVSIEVQPLIKYLPEDALFQKYQENTEERIAAQYRNPPLLRGRSQDYTRATSREATKFFEQFVGIPERQRFDDTINYEVFPDMGITLLLFRSRGPDTTDPESQVKILEVLAESGGLVPRDLRQQAELLLGRELGKIKHDWVNYPLSFSTVGISSGAILPPGTKTNTESSENQDGKTEHDVRDLKAQGGKSED